MEVMKEDLDWKVMLLISFVPSITTSSSNRSLAMSAALRL